MNRSVWRSVRAALVIVLPVSAAVIAAALINSPSAALNPGAAQPRVAGQPGLAAGPFSAAVSPVLAWAPPSSTESFRLEIARDEAFSMPLFRAVGRGPGLSLPAACLPDGHRYFMRLATASGRDEWSAWSRPAWFVTDVRFVGYSQISLHHYPFGKSANHNLIRDRRGRLHLVFAALSGSQREIFYGMSMDDGISWNFQTLPHEVAGHKVNYPSMALDPAETTAHIAWSEGERFPGRLVYCALNIADKPVLCSDPQTLSTEDTRTCLCTMPALAVGTDGVAHAVWQVGFDPRSCDVAYANNRHGWSKVTRLQSTLGNGVGPIMRLDAAGTIHVVWEGGQYRSSTDGGASWCPPLDQPPAMLFSELTRDGWRSRHCSLALTPDRSRLFAVTAAEHVLPDRDGMPVWTGPVNVHSIWLKEITGGQSGALELVREVPGRCLTLDEARQHPVGVHFVIVPSLSAAADGAVACAWQEVEVRETRKVISAYARIRDAAGTWAEPFEIGGEPDSATVSPLLTPNFGQALDVVWSESEHYDWREFLGNDVNDDFPLYGVYHGIFVSQYDREGRDARVPAPEADSPPLALADWDELEEALAPGLTARVASTAGQRIGFWNDETLPSFYPDEREHLPNMVTLARPSALAPSHTATPTRTPSPTPAPQGTRLSLEIEADTWTNSFRPDQNYGNSQLSVEKEPDRQSHSFLRAALTPDPAINLLSASLEMYLEVCNGITLSFRQPQAPWEEYTLTWNNMPELAASGMNDQFVVGSEREIHFDATYPTRSWLAGEPNNGVCLMALNDGTYSVWASCESYQQRPPRLVIYYTLFSPTPSPTSGPSSTPTPLPTLPPPTETSVPPSPTQPLPPSATPVPPTPTSPPPTDTPVPPSATPAPSPTPDPADLVIDLAMSASWFQPGDAFRLYLGYTNAGPGFSADQYVILDVYETYFFWPSWTQNVESQPRDIQPEASPPPETILSFVWPETDQAADGIRFWAGFVLPGSTALLGYDMAEFSYGP